jgi:hypothetical protein
MLLRMIRTSPRLSRKVAYGSLALAAVSSKLSITPPAASAGAETHAPMTLASLQAITGGQSIQHRLARLDDDDDDEFTRNVEGIVRWHNDHVVVYGDDHGTVGVAGPAGPRGFTGATGPSVPPDPAAPMERSELPDPRAPPDRPERPEKPDPQAPPEPLDRPAWPGLPGSADLREPRVSRVPPVPPDPLEPLAADTATPSCAQWASIAAVGDLSVRPIPRTTRTPVKRHAVPTALIRPCSCASRLALLSRE